MKKKNKGTFFEAMNAEETEAVLTRYPAEDIHMARWDRNERLYKTLLGMGLDVSPVVKNGRLMWFCVSA